MVAHIKNRTEFNYLFVIMTVTILCDMQNKKGMSIAVRNSGNTH